MYCTFTSSSHARMPMLLLGHICLQDSWSDLQLFLLLNLVVICAGVIAKYLVVNALDGESANSGLWQNLYQVFLLIT